MMTKINKTYDGTKTGKNLRIDWDSEKFCISGRSYLDGCVRNSAK